MYKDAVSKKFKCFIISIIFNFMRHILLSGAKNMPLLVTQGATFSSTTKSK
jgi:hypothetical protein